MITSTLRATAALLAAIVLSMTLAAGSAALAARAAFRDRGDRRRLIRAGRPVALGDDRFGERITGNKATPHDRDRFEVEADRGGEDDRPTVVVFGERR